MQEWCSCRANGLMRAARGSDNGNSSVAASFVNHQRQAHLKPYHTAASHYIMCIVMFMPLLHHNNSPYPSCVMCNSIVQDCVAADADDDSDMEMNVISLMLWLIVV